MRRPLIIASLLGTFAAATPASATTVVIYQDPMTLDRRTVIVDDDGPDRAFWCMLPPSAIGCRPVPVKRGR